jgi:5-methyltetrahydropteroyltriglutamate--homocysteine methyltransferase
MKVVTAIRATLILVAVAGAFSVRAEGHHWSYGKHGGPAEWGELDHAFASCKLGKMQSPPLATFMTAASPGIIATTMLNAHYDTYEAYVFAVAREMRKEYELIADNFILQIDAPDLAMERTVLFHDKTVPEFLEIAEMHVAALNEALANIPRDRVRLHCCWGNYEGPHVHDVPLAEVMPVLTGAKVGGLSIEFANPRHSHEYAAFRKAPLPKHMLLLPGVIETTSNFVEHPEVVARRIEEAVAAVGDRERVIASTDCGFGTFTKREWVIEPVVWLKLKAIREGADIASQRLWGKKVA